MTLSQRVNVITLAVIDLAASKAFWGRLGWRPDKDEPGYAAYQAAGVVVFLYPADKMPEELNGRPAPGRSYLALNLNSEAEVDAQFADALNAGAAEIRPPERQFWGGYSGVFADLDGHYWELAYNPAWLPGEDGQIRI